MVTITFADRETEIPAGEDLELFDGNFWCHCCEPKHL